jgi:hypothetical protein
MIYIIAYIFSIYILYAIVFYKIVFPIKQKNLVVFLNNCEARWWWGFITHQIEINFLFWIPYKIKNINFLDINSYVEDSIEPFKSNLSQNISFRDCNYSIFNEENYKRLDYFSSKSLWYRHKNIILFNFSFIESIFWFISINFWWIKFDKNSLFLALSHIVSDNPNWAYGRKNIILNFWIKLLFIMIFIPFYPHYIIIKIIENIKQKNLFILNESFKDIPKWNYIWIEENNLIWRKWNRYLSNYTEYNFYVEELKDDFIYWKWIIKIFKTLLVWESFPIAWEYIASIRWVFSDNFSYDDDYKIINIKNNNSIFYEIPFFFRLPKEWEINIIKWPWSINNNVSVNFQTKIFHLVPKTNLKSKIDHLNREITCIKNNFLLKYNVFFDKSIIKFQWMKILDDWLISIHFNKELKDINKDSFKISYKWIDIAIESIEKNDDKTNIIIYYKKWSIEKYDFKIEKEIAYLYISNIQDLSWNIYYDKNNRKLRLIWEQK